MNQRTNLPDDSDGAREVELATLDLRYEGLRMKQTAIEEPLFRSMAQRGIEKPLEGVDVGGTRILLNGFKRVRCARKLRLTTAPYRSLGADLAAGMRSLLRSSPQRALSLIEQAAFLDELNRLRPMSLAELAAELSRSKSWVSIRLGLIAELRGKVRQRLFSGAFPVYAYLYHVRPFMRINGVKPEQIEEFVVAVSGKGLSVREVEQLAHGYFRGPESFRREIRQGNVALPLQRMRQTLAVADGCTEFERVLLQDLERTQKYMQRVMGKSQDDRLQSRAFHAQSHLLTTAILSRSAAFFQTMRQLHDRNGQA